MLTIACVLRAGGKVGYDASWVEKLHNMLKRNISLPFELVCLSDVDVPCQRIPLDPIGSGYWAKLQLFRPAQFSGPVLFFDLDTVICNNIDLLIERLIEQQNFVMWRDDWYNLSSSAIMFWNGDYSHIYKSYVAQAEHYHDQYSAENQGPLRLIGDQAVISTLTPHVFVNDFVPADWIHVVSKDDRRYNLDQCRILIFRKTKSKPSTHLDHVLVKEHWH